MIQRRGIHRNIVEHVVTVRLEDIEVPAHTTQRLTLGDWVFTSVRTGCIRVQNGNFTAYIPAGLDEMTAFANFVEDHITRTIVAQRQHSLEDRT